MRSNTVVPLDWFKALFDQSLPARVLKSLVRQSGPRRRRPPRISALELIQGLVFHAVAPSGTLAAHVKALSGQSITDGALSQRRALLPATLFERIMAAALKPKARPSEHPQAFYHGLRLCGLDGSQFSVANTPQIKKQMRKAKSRRGRAAFPKVGVAVMVELGLHNPLAASIGTRGESEMVLAKSVLEAQPKKSLLIMDRYYEKGSEITIDVFWRVWGDCRSGSFLATAGWVIKSPWDYYKRSAPKCRESKGLCQMFGDNAMIRISGD